MMTLTVANKGIISCMVSLCLILIGIWCKAFYTYEILFKWNYDWTNEGMNKMWLSTNLTVLSSMAAAYETTCKSSQISGKALLISLIFFNDEIHLKWLPIDYFRKPQLQIVLMFTSTVIGGWGGEEEMPGSLITHFASSGFCFHYFPSWTACLFLRDS